MLRQQAVGSVAALAAMVLVGSSVAAASALASYPIAGGQALRYGVAAVLLLVLVGGRLPRLTGAEALRLSALAATGLAGFNALLIAAVREADAASVGVVVGCVPVALAVAGPLMERRALSRRVVGAALVVAVGAAAVQWSGGEMTLLGLVLSLGALACEAAFTLLAVPLLGSLGPAAVSTYSCLLAAPMLGALGLAVDGSGALRMPTVDETVALGYLAALVTAVGFVLWYAGVERLGAERAGLLAGVMPVAALLSAAAIGASELTLLPLLGALVVGAGVTAGLTGRSEPRAQPRNARTGVRLAVAEKGASWQL
jgi:drug/metabolite transporter (DMT)-like permease